MHRRTFLASSLALTAAATASVPGTAFAGPLAPFKLFDTHAHLRSSDLARYPLRSDISDALRDDVVAHPLTPEGLLAMWADAGVETGCAVQFNDFYQTDNRYLLDSVERFPRRMSGVVVLDPTDPATPGALMAMTKAYRISAVRYASRPDATDTYQFLTDAAHRGWEAANDLGITLNVLAAPPNNPAALPRAMAGISAFAARYPRLNVVIDHLGFPASERTPNFGFSPEHLELAGHPNVYFKYTTFLAARMIQYSMPHTEVLSYAVSVYGANRFVWGSAVGNNMVRTFSRAPPGATIPRIDTYRDRVQLALESASGLTLAQKRAIFYDNGRALFTPRQRR